MKQFVVLFRIVANVLWFSATGAVLCAIGGGMLCWVIALPFMLLNVSNYSNALMQAGVGFVGLGFCGGAVVFAIAGLIQSAMAEFDRNYFGLNLRFENCLNAIVRSGGFFGLCGALTGALIAVALFVYGVKLLPQFQSAAMAGALWGGHAGYLLGLLVGAIAPDVVFKVRDRWREWRRKG